MYLAEASSSASRHPQPLDTDNLMDTDVMLLTGLTNEPQLSPDAMLQDLCNFVGKWNISRTTTETEAFFQVPR